MISSAPSSTKRRPIAAPSPEPPPVTNIRFPANRPFSNIRLSFARYSVIPDRRVALDPDSGHC
jgi:hypothetical protein